jgi:hypothetical protein
VALLPTSGSSLAYYVGLATDHDLYIRSDTQGWQRLTTTSTYCLDNPAVVLNYGLTTLTIFCEGSDHSLYSASSGPLSSGLPQLGSWSSWGGGLKYGPAAALVNGTLTAFVIGTDSTLYSRTASTNWSPLPWQCIGHPAVASGGTTSYLGCQGLNHALYYAQNTGSGWSAPRSAGGQLIDGPGIAASLSGATYFVEGTNTGLFHTVVPAGGTAGGYTSDGGSIRYGVGAGGL